MNQAYNEPGAFPYEIWQYYQLEDGQSNVLFVFYNSDRVSDNFTLIHSTERTEVNDPRWELKVYGHNPNSGVLDFDQETIQQNIYGSRRGDN